MAHGVADRKDSFLARKGFANDVGEEAGSREIWFSGTHADRGHAERYAIKEAAAGIVVEQEFVDGFLGAVAGERRGEELIADGLRERCAKDRDGRGENHLRLVVSG